jgi:hypothetical protein
LGCHQKKEMKGLLVSGWARTGPVGALKWCLVDGGEGVAGTYHFVLFSFVELQKQRISLEFVLRIQVQIQNSNKQMEDMQVAH